MGALDRMRQASRNGQKYSAIETGALDRMRAAGAAQANRKQETTRVKSEIPTPAINTRNSGSSGLSSSAKVSQRVASDWKAFQDKQKQRAQTQAKVDSLSKQLSERSASGDMGGTTLMRTELDRLNNQLKYGNAVYKNDWTGQTKAKYAQTALSLDAGKAANDYLNRPTQENWQAAVQARDALEDFQTRNRTALSAGSGKSAGDTTLGDSIQSFVGNLPQLGSQLKSAAQYGAVGAGAGSVIPLVGTVSGLKVGVAAGSAAESYALMRGSAFMELMELGVDEETARKAAGDEAFLSALVEMGDTLMDVSGVGLGAGSLINAAKTGVVRALAKEGAEAAAENAAAKVLKLAGKYGLNILQEAGEEGIQQSVSIANRNRLVKTGVQTGSPLLGYTVISPSAASVGELLGESVKTLGRALTGKDAQARDEIARAALEGGKIAAVSGSVMPVVQTAVGAGAGTIAKAVQTAAEPARTRVQVSQEEPAAAYITPKYETASVESPARYEGANDTTPEPDAVETSGDPFTQPDGQRQFLTGLNEGEEADWLSNKDLDAWERLRQENTPETALEKVQFRVYTEKEKTINGGERIYLRHGGQRSGGSDSRRTVSGVEEGAGRHQGRNTESRPADRGAAALTYGEQVSVSSLGIPGGSDVHTIRPVTGGETAAVRQARQLAQERGFELVLFGGGNLSIRAKNGSVVSARAFIIGQKVFVRADHPVYTADQLMRHETGHDMIAKGEIRLDDVRKRIRDAYGSEKLDELSWMYAEAYEGSGMTAEEIWEEIICDSLGDMNIFAEQENAETVAELQEAIKKAFTKGEVEKSRGPPEEKASREPHWRTDLSRVQFERLRQWVKYDIKTSTNNISDTANWTFHEFDGLPVFAIYSTENQSDPTILYEVKGNQAKFERDVLKEFLEEIKNGKNIDGKPSPIDTIFSRSWMRNSGGHVNSYGAVVRGRNSGNAGVLRQQSGRKPGAAFESVLRNLLQVQENGVSGKVSLESTDPPAIKSKMAANTQTRKPGRVKVSQEDFAQAYRKRISEDTEKEIPAQYESFQKFVSGQDAVETAEGIMTRAEIKERLAGLYDEKEVDQLVDGLLDAQERAQQSGTPDTLQMRKTGRVKVSMEDFAAEYREQFPQTTAEAIPSLYESFKKFTSGQDVVETSEGLLTRAEIKQRLAGLYDEKEVDQLVDGLLDAQERAQKVNAEQALLGKASRETGRRAQRGRSIELETMENNRFQRLRRFYDDLPKEWYAFTKDYFYVYSNQSYTDYTILVKARIDESNRADINNFMEELENGTFDGAEAFNSWTSTFRRGKGRDSWYRISAAGTRTAGRDDGVDVRARGSEHGGNSKGGRKTGQNGKLSREITVPTSAATSSIVEFDKTHLAQNEQELLPNYKKAHISDTKLSGYALDMGHPTGKHKAIAFKKALGYTVNNKYLLLSQVKRGLTKYRATERPNTKYGRPFEVSMMIFGANGKYAKIKTGWIIDNGESEPRLTSIYVDE